MADESEGGRRREKTYREKELESLLAASQKREADLGTAATALQYRAGRLQSDLQKEETDKRALHDELMALSAKMKIVQDELRGTKEQVAAMAALAADRDRFHDEALALRIEMERVQNDLREARSRADTMATNKEGDRREIEALEREKSRLATEVVRLKAVLEGSGSAAAAAENANGPIRKLATDELKALRKRI